MRPVTYIVAANNRVVKALGHYTSRAQKVHTDSICFCKTLAILNVTIGCTVAHL